MSPTVYLVKNPITHNGKMIIIYFEFLLIPIMDKTNIQIEIEIAGTSNNPLDKFNKNSVILP